MSNPYFQFKQFTIRHDKCAMKVGTDGVLLGAWADVQSSQHILDVGTGSGLIAIMLAQRSHAVIDAIDIDYDACLQARENAGSSPFAGRIHIEHSPLAEYANHCSSKYDLIVSNPPYFIASLKCPDGKRSLARHTDTLLLEDLVKDCSRLLTENGRIALILPFEQTDYLYDIAKKYQLFLRRRTNVIPQPNAAPKRLLVELSVQPHTSAFTGDLTIEESRHQYTEAYKTLTRDFYLKM